MSQILAEIWVLNGTVWFRFLSIDLLSGVAWKWKNLLLNLHWSEIDAPKMDTHPHLTPQRPIYEMHVAKSYRSKLNHEKITLNRWKLASIDFTLAGNEFLRFNQFRKKMKKEPVIVGVLDRLVEFLTCPQVFKCLANCSSNQMLLHLGELRSWDISPSG